MTGRRKMMRTKIRTLVGQNVVPSFEIIGRRIDVEDWPKKKREKKWVVEWVDQMRLAEMIY